MKRPRATLTPDQYSAMMLHAPDEKSVREIAREMISEGFSAAHLSADAKEHAAHLAPDAFVESKDQRYARRGAMFSADMVRLASEAEAPGAKPDRAAHCAGRCQKYAAQMMKEGMDASHLTDAGRAVVAKYAPNAFDDAPKSEPSADLTAPPAGASVVAATKPEAAPSGDDTAAELARLRARVAELESTAATTKTEPTAPAVKPEG